MILRSMSTIMIGNSDSEPNGLLSNVPNAKYFYIT